MASGAPSVLPLGGSCYVGEKPSQLSKPKDFPLAFEIICENSAKPSICLRENATNGIFKPSQASLKLIFKYKKFLCVYV